MQVLTGHTSPETAYVVNDYPYGFRLRCKIRYWIEYKARKGFRFVSQTTNPKRAGEVWNKPKASTYIALGAVMLLNEENGHISWTGTDGYDTEKTTAWRDEYGEALEPAILKNLNAIIAAKQAYDKKRKEVAGEDNPTYIVPLDVGMREAYRAFGDEIKKD